MDRATPSPESPAPRDPATQSGPDPNARAPQTAPGRPDLIVATAFVQTIRHFFPDLNDWLQALPDSRDRDAITYETRFLAWTGLFLFVLQLGSRRQLDFAFDRYSDAALANLNRLANTQQESLPVHDTLDHFHEHVPWYAYHAVRLLMVRRLIRMKALDDARLLGHYVVPLDGTGLKRRWTFHALDCTETSPLGEKHYFAWITGLFVTKTNAAHIAEKGGRARWKIENEAFNRQKNHGPNLEHAYSLDPEKWKAYYYLLQIAFLITQLVERGSLLRQLAAELHRTPQQLFGSLANIVHRLREILRWLHWPDDCFDEETARCRRIGLVNTS